MVTQETQPPGNSDPSQSRECHRHRGIEPARNPKGAETRDPLCEPCVGPGKGHSSNLDFRTKREKMCHYRDRREGQRPSSAKPAQYTTAPYEHDERGILYYSQIEHDVVKRPRVPGKKVQEIVVPAGTMKFARFSDMPDA